MVYTCNSNIRVGINATRIFLSYRDDLENHVDNLTFVSDIELVDYENEEHLTKITRLWTPDNKMIPHTIRSYGAMFKYKDEAVWDEINLRVLFVIKPYPYLTNMYEINGKTQFIYVSENETEIRNHLEINFIGGSVIPSTVEEMFGKLIVNAIEQTTRDIITNSDTDK